MIEKILNALRNREEELGYSFKGVCDTEDLKIVHKVQEVMHCMEIVQEVAQEYGDGWISVEERLPTKEESKNERLWITDSDGWTYEGDFDIETGRWSDMETGGFISVIAWQPLPASYQPKGE